MCSSECVNICLFFNTENDFEELVAKFQLALYHHYENQGPKLYHPTAMRAFAELNSPGLFDMLLKAITHDDVRLHKPRRKTQEQRTVALLHILAHFRLMKMGYLVHMSAMLYQNYNKSQRRVIVNLIQQGHACCKLLLWNYLKSFETFLM